MSAASRTAALNEVMDKLDHDDRSTLAHALLGSLTVLVSDDEWNQALAIATEFTDDAIERRRVRMGLAR